MNDREDGSSGYPLSGDTIPARGLRRLFQYADASARVDQKVPLLEGLHAATSGSAEGLEIALEWTASWEDDPGPEMIRRLWAGWREKPPNAGFDAITRHLASQGFNWRTLVEEPEPEEQGREPPEAESPPPKPPKPPPELLLRFSLVDELSKLKSEVLVQEPLCSGLALKAQANVWYAEPNTGKTAMAIWFLVRDIQSGRLDPSRIFYFNLDDTLHGLIEKIQMAKANGFHVISEGYRGFQAADFPMLIHQLINADQCQGVVIVLDTLKKFTDIMDKGKSSSFGKLIRSFVLRGGTCIALAHTNKRRNADGEPIYAGTSDILEDFDCGFIVYETDLDLDSQTKTILFRNKKSRGTVRKQASFQYSVREGLSYDTLLDSILEVDEANLRLAQQQKQVQSDLSLIEVVREGIRSGTNTKMALAALLVQRAQCSKRTAIRVIEQYEGTDPETHFWNFEVGPRGAKMYRLLGP